MSSDTKTQEKHQTTQKDASRVQRVVALANNGIVSKDSVAARMTRAALMNKNKK